MKRIHTPILASAALLAALCAGCFEHGQPRRDVTATSMDGDEDSRAQVTFLDLHEDAALASFPEGLGAYPNLRRLSVRGRKAAAAVPPSIAEAKGLRELDLAGTGLTDLPAELAELGALRTLYLTDNGLAALPPAVCGLSGLTYLNLDRNALTTLPEEVGAMKALKWVRLNGNRLADLPASAAEWRDVRRLYLRGNGLTNVPPAILKMTSLEELDLGENDLAALPEALCALPNLRRIDLDGNRRLERLPDAITNMPALTHLFVFGCPISTNELARIRAGGPDDVRLHLGF